MGIERKLINNLIAQMEKEKKLHEREAVANLTNFRINKETARDILKSAENEGVIQRRRGRLYIKADSKF